MVQKQISGTILKRISYNTEFFEKQTRQHSPVNNVVLEQPLCMLKTTRNVRKWRMKSIWTEIDISVSPHKIYCSTRVLIRLGNDRWNFICHLFWRWRHSIRETLIVPKPPALVKSNCQPSVICYVTETIMFHPKQILYVPSLGIPVFDPNFYHTRMSAHLGSYCIPPNCGGIQYGPLWQWLVYPKISILLMY